MIKTCEEFAIAHNLRFSTDAKPSKCKTKCMAFLHHQRELPNMKLNDNPLPWVSELVHLGTKITNEVNGCQKDIVEKKARYIDRACNLNQ